MFTNLLEITEAYSCGILPHPFQNLCYICHLSIVSILILSCKLSQQVTTALTGFVNAVIWPRLWEKQRAEILGASVLAVDGVVETDGEVHHLIAERVHDFSHLAVGLSTKSRDFC